MYKLIDMKKLFIALSFAILACFSAGAQALLGYSMGDVRKEFPNEDWEYGKWGERKEYSTMSFKADKLVVIYYFNENMMSVGTSIVPLTQGMLQGMIEIYNERYVVVDDKHWKFYNKGNVMRCSLSSTDEGLFYFYWQL